MIGASVDEHRQEWIREAGALRMAVSAGERDAVAVFMERLEDGSVVVLDIVKVECACR